MIFFLPFSGDGLIQEKELQHVMRACMDENGMKFDEGEVDDLTRALFHDATTITNASRKASSCCGGAQATEQAEAAFAQPRQQKLSVTGHTLAAASNLLGGGSGGGGHKLSVASQALAAAAADGGGITFEALKAQLTKHEGLLQVISLSRFMWRIPLHCDPTCLCRTSRSRSTVGWCRPRPRTTAASTSASPLTFRTCFQVRQSAHY